MANNKVIFGNTTIMDISDSTVTAETLKKDEIAYNAAGQRIVGTMEGGGGSSSITIPYISGGGVLGSVTSNSSVNVSVDGYTNLSIGSRTITNASGAQITYQFIVQGKNSTTGSWTQLLNSSSTSSTEQNIDITNYSVLQFQAIVRKTTTSSANVTIKYNNLVIS